MYLKDSKTVVIKIGSSLLINDKKIVREKWLTEFAKDVQYLKKLKKNIILVSSGAIALGCKKLKLSKKKLKLDKSQAVASIGQIELMNLFKKTFNKSKINLSQILLTLEDTEKRRRAINAKRTFENLFKLGAVPIVNENDTTATSEIKLLYKILRTDDATDFDDLGYRYFNTTGVDDNQTPASADEELSTINCNSFSDTSDASRLTSVPSATSNAPAGICKSTSTSSNTTGGTTISTVLSYSSNSSTFLFSFLTSLSFLSIQCNALL